MQDVMLAFRDAPLADAPLVMRPAGGLGSFSFDSAEYDEVEDRLRLRSGPPSAESEEITPEGHVLRISAPDGMLSGVVLTAVRRRLLADGCVPVTLSPHQRVVLDAGDIAHLLTSRRRTGRFART